MISDVFGRKTFSHTTYTSLLFIAFRFSIIHENTNILIYDYFLALICSNGKAINNIC